MPLYLSNQKLVDGALPSLRSGWVLELEDKWLKWDSCAFYSLGGRGGRDAWRKWSKESPMHRMRDR